ncbi:MAG: DUF120 domain-containing protein [Nitrososphaerota archaeon]|nr:DUF120 domain-containing protein [Nitrososphaerota archaeon]
MAGERILVRGEVFSGKGQGGFFVSIPWAMKQFIEKLGFKPYPGTLNIRLFPEYLSIRRKLNYHNGIKIVPDEGYYPGRCFKSIVAGKINGAIVIPETPSYPEDVLEIIAPVNLREELDIKDGDKIEITIILE